MGEGEKSIREEGEKNVRAGAQKNAKEIGKGDGGMGRKKVLERVKEEAVRSEGEREMKMVILEGVGVAECVGEMVGVDRGGKDSGVSGKKKKATLLSDRSQEQVVSKRNYSSLSENDQVGPKRMMEWRGSTACRGLATDLSVVSLVLLSCGGVMIMVRWVIVIPR